MKYLLITVFIIVIFLIMQLQIVIHEEIRAIHIEISKLKSSDDIYVRILSEKLELYNEKINKVNTIIGENSYQISQFEVRCHALIPDMINQANHNWRYKFNSGDMTYNEKQYLIKNKPNTDGYVELIEKEKYERKQQRIINRFYEYFD